MGHHLTPDLVAYHGGPAVYLCGNALKRMECANLSLFSAWMSSGGAGYEAANSQRQLESNFILCLAKKVMAKSAPKKVAPKNAAPKKVAKKAAPKKAAPKKNVKKAAPKKAAKKAAPKKKN